MQHAEFSFLLTEKVCPLVIRLFSPSLKYRMRSVGSSSPAVPSEKPHFPIVMRLLRIVAVLIKHYYKLLVSIKLETKIRSKDCIKCRCLKEYFCHLCFKKNLKPQLLSMI
jgi:hypothetical protein